jgi:hypothetical protein
MEARKIRPATVTAVINAEMINARWKLVRVHASTKFSKRSGQGKPKPVPVAASCVDLSAITTVK